MKLVEVWECDNCHHIVYFEQEVICWECGEGEMIYQGETYIPE